MPTVTVVIPTRGRVELTRACLESIQMASAADGVPVEVFVVDSSPAAERTQLQAMCEQLGVELIPGPPSVSEKRNLGAERARAAYVLFVDSDCGVAPGCLAAHLTTLQQPEAHASQGAVEFRGPERLAFRAVRRSGILIALTLPHKQSVRWALSANLMVRRVPFLAVRFDPGLGPPGLGGEDVDFGLRFSSRGFRIVGTSGALVYHETATWNTLRANVARFFSWGRSDAHLVERHPTMSYVDMPSPVLVALLLGVASVATACWSVVALLALPLGLLSFATCMTGAGARHSPEDRLGGALGHWVFFVLDLGRVWESFRRARPHVALQRLRFVEDQVTQEWRDLVPTSWAVWLMVLVGIVCLWWAVQ
jgi:glycosyltransferase involved in cell wall biosynthesis